MLQKLNALTKFVFVLLIILLVITILLTIYTSYIVNKSLDTFGENKGVYVFDSE